MVTTIKTVSQQMKVAWVWTTGIIEREVKRGLARRESRPIEDLAVDKTASQKTRNYVTVLKGRKPGTIIEILDDRKMATLCQGLEENHNCCWPSDLSRWMYGSPSLKLRVTIEGDEEKIYSERFYDAA